MKLFKSALLALAALCAGSTAYATEHMKSLNPDFFDKTTSAGEDFYKFVNQGWMDANQLTPEYSRYGQFNILTDSSNNRIKNIVLNLAASNPEKGTVAYKVATIYEQAMDSVRRNREGAEPIKADLAKIENTTHEGMTDLLLWIHANYASPFFGAGPMEDLGNSKVYAMYVSSGGMTLGDRDYYLANDSRNKEVREAYKKLIIDNMRLAGYSKKEANRIMKNVMKIETALADSAWTREQSRNLPAMYNVRTFAQLKEMYNNIPWDRFFIETMGIESPETVIVTELSSVAQANNLIGTLTDREIKDYYLWQYVRQAAGKLSDDFTNASFEFNKVMSGVSAQQPRWKRALSATEGLMGEAIGQLYVEKYFPESSKQYMLELVENLRNALGKHIIELPWMSSETKLKAIQKLSAFTVKIGYPDKWDDYSKLIIDPALSYYETCRKMSEFEWDKHVEEKWGKPVDRTEWFMTPQTVNAYYNPTTNEICFPAGILQYPFFDMNEDDAFNYGAIGVVIGHEMTHGFDDQGRQFDKDGNFANWWTDEDSKSFNERTQVIIDFFNKIEVLPGLNANGELTVGENIADHGGLTIAMQAFQNATKENPLPVKDGFTPEQRFYLSYSNVWAGHIRDEEARNLTKSDPHSLSRWRVNGTLPHIDEWYTAFGITEKDPLFVPAEERLRIW